MGFVVTDQLRQLGAKAIASIGGDMVEFVDGDERIVEGLDAQFVKGKTEGRMGADQHLVIAGQKLAKCLDLGLGHLGIIGTRRVAQVPLRGDVPIGEEAIFAQRLAGEAGADGPLRHADNRLLDALIDQLVERDEHQCPRFARGGRRFDQQILLAALVKGLRLHGAHAQFIRLGAYASASGAEGDGGDDVGILGH